jgi:signal transduction histidine kinase
MVAMNEKGRPAVWCIEHKRPLIMSDYERDFQTYFGEHPFPKTMSGQRMESVTYWPLIARREIIGVLTVQCKSKNAYQPYQQSIIRTLASTTALALDNVNAYSEIERRKREVEEKVTERTAELEQSNQHIRALSEICTDIGSTLDLNTLMNTVYNRIKLLMDVDAFSIGLFDAEKQQIKFKLAIEGGQYLPESVVYMTEKNSSSVWCIDHKKPVVINDYARDFPRYFGNMPIPKPKVGVQSASLIFWPLVVGDQIIGVLTVQSFEKNAYDEHHQDIVKTLASTTAIALDNARAYAKVEKQNREIIDTQQQLVLAEKMVSLGTLTAGVAHEINNPTNFVYVSAQNMHVDLEKFKTFLFALAGDDADDEVLESFKQHFDPLFEQIDTIQNGSERIKTIVQDLRSFTRLDEADNKAVRITECLISTLNLVRSKYRDQIAFGSSFNFDPKIHCQPSQLNQVFMNILVNACEAIDMDQESDRKTKGYVNIITDLADDQLQITFTDNGCGMDEETKNKLFEPFYTTKGVGEGTGLGMSISFGIIQDHKGSIDIISEVGKGSQFIISLPL